MGDKITEMFINTREVNSKLPAGGHVQQDLVDKVWFYKIYYILFLRQNHQQSGIIQIYYGIIVNVCICDKMMKTTQSPFTFIWEMEETILGEVRVQKQYN